MAPSQGDILHEHTQQIAAIQVDLEKFRGELASMTDEHESFQDTVRRLSQQIGEAPRPDEGVEGHGLARAIHALSERIEPIVEERAKAEKEAIEAPLRRRNRIQVAISAGALLVAALTFATKTATPSAAAPPPVHAIVDASTN